MGRLTNSSLHESRNAFPVLLVLVSSLIDLGSVLEYAYVLPSSTMQTLFENVL